MLSVLLFRSCQTIKKYHGTGCRPNMRSMHCAGPAKLRVYHLTSLAVRTGRRRFRAALTHLTLRRLPPFFTRFCSAGRSPRGLWHGAKLAPARTGVRVRSETLRFGFLFCSEALHKVPGLGADLLLASDAQTRRVQLPLRFDGCHLLFPTRRHERSKLGVASHEG